MGAKDKSADANNSSDGAYWVWMGLFIAFVAMSNSRFSRRIERERPRDASPRMVATMPVTVEAHADDHDIHSRSTSNIIVEHHSQDDDEEDDDDDDNDKERTLRSRMATREVVKRADGTVVMDSIRGGSVRAPRSSGANQQVIVIDSKESGRAREYVGAAVGDLTEGRIKELEAKLEEAGEKLRHTAERVGSKVTDKVVSRISSERSRFPMPPVPPVPPVAPMAPQMKPERPETPQPARIVVKSDPCATREKAIKEAEDQLTKIVSKRLASLGLGEMEYVRKAIDSVRPKYVVEESFREVAGERYPLYVATADIELGANFERQALRLVNQQTAHHRFSGLMGISFGIVALLIGLDRLVLGRSGKAVTTDKSLV